METNEGLDATVDEGLDAPGTTETPAAETPAPEPEKFEKFDLVSLGLPEDAPLDHEYVDSIATLAKDLGLTKEQAEKLAQATLVREHENGKRTMDAVETARKEWVETAKKDPEYGGAKFAENMGVAKKAYDKFFPEAIREVFKKTGLSSHPELIRACYKIGSKIREDTPVPGGGAPPVKLEPFYPTMQKET